LARDGNTKEEEKHYKRWKKEVSGVIQAYGGGGF
jgi:hypothetical protein